MPDELEQGRRWARDWLFEAALPLWWRAGADHAQGGFHDKLSQSGEPLDLPKRIRVQARQIFVFAEAGRLGWDGPWREAVEFGLAFLLAAYRRGDGLFRASVDRAGKPVAEDPDLYDQAFVLFALAAAWRALGRPAALRAEALGLIDALRRERAHPAAGFEEARPRRLPLRSNPHMHMLEALLAWVELDETEPFSAEARRIVRLARERFIDADTGAVAEYFDGEWGRAAGEEGAIREPGHQFEWAYLLDLAERLLGGDHADAIDRLHRFGHAHGVIGGRAIFSVDAAGAPIDSSARLWAQTERLRTMLILSGRLRGAAAEEAKRAAAEALTTVRRFLDAPVPGLWRDRCDERGRLLDEPAPASSLYHIVTGLTPLIEG
ncbi:MAG TPA: AGE family epimerase/isomerase [Sphingomonas sp.]|nr:AGE family epimerase/isomerase [Sphingomonas sp.]